MTDVAGADREAVFGPSGDLTHEAARHGILFPAKLRSFGEIPKGENKSQMICHVLYWTKSSVCVLF